jgi:YHS domain-containing protein
MCHQFGNSFDFVVVYFAYSMEQETVMKPIRNFCAFALMFVSTAVLAADPPQFATENGAIDGYDPVGMIEAQLALRGDAAITANFSGAQWHFTSTEHRDRFMADPHKYAPQYGGYCAVGMTHGGLVPTDPTTFSISGSKLYLNVGAEQRKTWVHLQENMRPRADIQWQQRMASIEQGGTPPPAGYSGAAPSDDALGGVDVVSYFVAGKPMPGRAAYVVEHAGLRYRFANAEHQHMFAAEPQRYLPQYDGHCAVVMAHDFALAADPMHFEIHQGKLYLLLGEAVRATFLADPDWFITRADAHFAAMRRSQ